MPIIKETASSFISKYGAKSPPVSQGKQSIAETEFIKSYGSNYVSGGGGGGGSGASAGTSAIPTTQTIKIDTSKYEQPSQTAPQRVSATYEPEVNVPRFSLREKDTGAIIRGGTEPKATPVSWKEEVSSLGLFSGTLEFFGKKASESVEPQPLGMGDYLPYETKGTSYYSVERGFYPAISGEEEAFRIERKTEATKQAAYSTATTVPFLIPHIGFPLLAATGTESYVFSGGRERIKEQAKTFQEWGLGEGISKGIAWSLPAVKIGIGTVGTIKDVRGMIVSREMKALETTPTRITGARFEGEKGGLDVLYGYKRAGKTEYFTKLEQPFYKVGDSKVVFESGKQISFLSRGGKLKVSGFQTAGREYSAGAITRIKSSDFGAVKIPVTDWGSGYGKVISKEVFTGTLKVTKASGGRIFGKIYPSDVKITQAFIGGTKEGEGIVNLFGGGIKGMRYYPKSDKLTLVGKIEGYGTLRRITPDFFGGDTGLISSGGGAKSVFSKTAIETPLKSLSQVSASKSIGRIIPTTQITKNFLGTSQTQIQLSKQFPTYVGGTSVSEGIKEMQRSMQPLGLLDIGRTKTSSILSPRFFSGEMNVQVPKSAISPREAERLKPRFEQPTASFNIPPTILTQTPKFPRTPFLPPFYIPGFDIPSRKGKTPKGKRGFAYQPSLAAIGLGITGFKIPKGIETGLVLRPIIKKKKKRRNK